MMKRAILVRIANPSASRTGECVGQSPSTLFTDLSQQLGQVGGIEVVGAVGLLEPVRPELGQVLIGGRFEGCLHVLRLGHLECEAAVYLFKAGEVRIVAVLAPNLIK